ncbi:Hypothetical protein POVR1_LOCUS88 [uncultured virus]|nr:Hypothetical protein POVR1_LOCUS88 [uncultured virus]
MNRVPDFEKLNSIPEIFPVADTKFHKMLCLRFVNPIIHHPMKLEMSINGGTRFSIRGYQCNEDIIAVIDALKKYEVINVNTEWHFVENMASGCFIYDTPINSSQDFRDYVLTLEKDAALSISGFEDNVLSFRQMGTDIGMIRIFRNKSMINGASIAAISQLYNLMNQWLRQYSKKQR